MKTLTASSRFRGFTIVELLVVIAIIGIMASIATLSYITVQKHSRDDTRSADIVALKHAVNRYYQDNGEYPPSCPSPSRRCNVSYLTDDLKPYLDDIPHDPSFNGTATDYLYAYRAQNGSTTAAYAFYITYESKPGCKTGTNVPSTWFPEGGMCDD